MKKRKSLFSIFITCFLVIAALVLVAGTMTVNTLSHTKTQTQMTVAHETATQGVETAMVLNMVQTDQGLAALTPVKSIYLNGQFASAAVVPEPYNNLIFVSVSIKGKDNLTGMDIPKIYLLKTVQKTLKI